MIFNRSWRIWSWIACHQRSYKSNECIPSIKLMKFLYLSNKSKKLFLHIIWDTEWYLTFPDPEIRLTAVLDWVWPDEWGEGGPTRPHVILGALKELTPGGGPETVTPPSLKRTHRHGQPGLQFVGWHTQTVAEHIRSYSPPTPWQNIVRSVNILIPNIGFHWM